MKRKSFHIHELTGPFCILLAMALLLLIERSGIGAQQQAPAVAYLDKETLLAERQEPGRECLILIDGAQNTAQYEDQMKAVLGQMKIGCDTAEASEPLPSLEQYRTVVIAFADLEVLGDRLFTLCDWVEGGGRLMFQRAPRVSPLLQVIKGKIGILELGGGMVSVGGMRFVSDWMLGAEGRVYPWDVSWESSLAVTLKDGCTVHVVASEEPRTPMIWEYTSGKGKYVVNNHDLCEKVSRGLTAAAYSLLEDVCVYPVINASTFFFDDFPSPVPSGDGRYIREAYGRDIASFYSNVWWPDMLKLAEEYGLRYTGMIIEQYSDEVEPPFEGPSDTERFRYFGQMLLKNGGELGIHGYNHMPLCLDGFDFKGRMDYETWPSKEVMRVSIQEVFRFSRQQFGDSSLSVYVPPSNVLSEEGRAMLAENFPEIRTLSGLYLIEDYEFEQEFCISADGVINYPRIVSGCLLDGYMQWAAMNELNFHFVNTHFMHPDDVLDADRGAALGWEVLRGNLEQYIKWLYNAAPMLRNLTGSEGGAAVSRYDRVVVRRALKEEGISLELDDLYDEMYCMVRVNEGKPVETAGGELQHLSGNLYLLHAASRNVEIRIER